MAKDFLTQDEVDALLGDDSGGFRERAGPQPGSALASAQAAIELNDPAGLDDALALAIGAEGGEPMSAYAWSSLARAAVEADFDGCLEPLRSRWPFDDLASESALWLERAARRGSLACLWRLLSWGAADECAPGSGQACPALLAAAEAGHLPAVAALAERCDPWACDGAGDDAFSLACQSESLPCCMALLASLPDPFEHDARGWSALAKAARQGFMPALEACLDMDGPAPCPLELARAAGIALAAGKPEAAQELSLRARAAMEGRQLRRATLHAEPAAPIRARL